MRQVKAKECKICLIRYQPRNSLQKVCSLQCALAESRRAAGLKEYKTRKKALMTRTEHLKLLQGAVNKYVRLRDAKDGCISCDKPATWNGQWHASHYFSVGSSSAVRFNLWNIHKSCSQCNANLSGNIHEYTPRLIAKIGQERYDWLKSNHSNIVKYDVERIIRATKIARKAVRRLEKRV